jgi:hypothetical protein
VLFARWITKATHTHTRTHTHSEYVTLTAFPRQQWLHKRASRLRYTYTDCLYGCFTALLVIHVYGVWGPTEELRARTR